MASSPAELLEMATTRPQHVLSAAPTLLSAEEIPVDDAVTLWRALGMARRVTGDAKGSGEAFRRAVAIAEENRLDEQVVLNSISLAMSIGGTGDFTEALRVLDALDANDLVGKIRFQRATIYAMSGRLSEANDEFIRALEYLEAAGDRPGLALSFKNLGLVAHIQGDASRAVEHSELALALFTELDNKLEIASTGHNLGLANAGAGNLVAAIEWLNLSLPALEDIVGPTFEPGRCHTLLAAGLFEEARTEALRLVKRLREVGLTSEVPEAMLLAGEACLLLGDTSRAVEHARSAAARFDEQGRAAWTSAARLLALQASDEAIDRREIEPLLAALDAAGMTMAGMRARAAGARALAGQGDVAEATAMLASARQPKRRWPLSLQIELDLATVEVLLASGDRAAAARLAANGMRKLEVHQRAIAATDVRAGLGRHASRLAQRGLDLAVQAGDPRRIWAWMERSRATALAYPPVSAPDNDEVSSLLPRLRALTAATADPRASSDQLSEVARLEARIADLTRAAAGAGSREAVGGIPARALGTLGTQCLIEFGAVDDAMWAVVAYGGRVKLVDCGPSSGWEMEARQVSSAMRRALVAGGRGSGILQRRIAIVRELLDPLVPRGATRLIAVPPPGTAPFPWPSLSRIPVTVAPSTATWLRSLERTADTAVAIAIAGPSLDHATAEAKAVAQNYPGGRVLDQASAAEVLEAAESATMLHLACHGILRNDQPMFNSVRVADGELYLHELQRLPSLPSLVVLSSCESGSAAGSATEMLGMASVLISAGVRTVIASPWPVPDLNDTVAAMADLHHLLSKGVDPAVAVQTVSSSGPGIAYVAFGA